FRSLQEGLQLVCLDHARGKVLERDLPLTYPDPSFTPVKSTQGHFCCITGVAFQNEGRGPETYGYIVEKGDLSYILHSDPTDASTTTDEHTATKTYEVRVRANSKTQYLLRPRDLPSPDLCQKSYRGLYERAVVSVHGRQAPAALTIHSPSTLPPTAHTTSHGDEFCSALDDSVTKVSCRIPRFAEWGWQLQEFVVVEFFLHEGDWQEDDRHYSIPVAVDDQCLPLNVTHLAYYCFSLRGSVLSSCWAQGTNSNVPSEPACKNFDAHAFGPDKDHSLVIAIAFPSSSKNKRSKTDVQRAQRKKKDLKESTVTSTLNRKMLLPKNLTPSSSPSSSPSSPAETASTYKFTCTVCHMNLASRKGLNAHVQKHDVNRPTFACDVCNKTFTRPSDMERHKDTSHDNKKCPCEHCGRLLSRADGLLSHQRTCRERPSNLC
ncbi:hypothetical protein BGZ96_002880, partial [Linnemannia gamsii]